ncbi:hypothetical protein GGX14DRAFT_314634, partial [Mycena pura]
ENAAAPQESAAALVAADVVRMGSFFSTFEAGRDAIYQREAALGNIWRMGQTKRGNDGSVRRITIRCNHYGVAKETHRTDIDPSDHRAGRTLRTNCSAHVNLSVVAGGGWHVTLVNWEHNHAPEIPVGGNLPRPPTAEERELVVQYATASNFTRAHLSHILKSRFPGHVLEPKQVSNMMNAARAEATRAVDALGGDIQSVFD